MTVPPYQSQITVDKIKPSPQWLKDLRLQKEENSFLDPDFPSHINHDFILENSKQFLDRLSLLTDLYLDTTTTKLSFLPIDNYDVQVLGAKEDESGILHLGPGYDDLELGFRTLLVHYLAQFGDTVEANELMLELCSLRKIQEGSPITIQNINFNYDQTRKQWLQNWIDVFRQYQFTDSNSPLLKKMNEIIISREGNFAGTSNEFDLGRDSKKFNRQEFLLAERVISVLAEIFGSYMFKEMFSGGVMVKDGTVQFMSHPWRGLTEIYRKVGARFAKGTPYGEIPDRDRPTYILDKFTSSFDIVLPTDGTVDISDAIISLVEIPVKFLLPMYKKPTDKSLHSDFYKVVSSDIYEHYEALNHFSREALTRSWRSQFYKMLMRICRDRGYDSLQLSLQDQGIRPKLFADWEYTRDFRNNAFDWLTSRGEGLLTLEHKNGELKLERSDFLRYFKDDWAKFASSLHLPNIVDRTPKMEFDLRYMQDFIMGTIAFIFELAETSVNKRLVLYPQTAYKDGYGITSSKYNPPVNPDLNEWIINTARNIGFVLDLKNQLQFLPTTIGNLKNLKKLNLSHNKLTLLPESIGNLTSLEELNLKNNNLTTLPRSMIKMPNLRILRLYGNNLKPFPEHILDIKSLEQISFSQAMGKNLPNEIGDFTRSKFLHSLFLRKR